MNLPRAVLVLFAHPSYRTSRAQRALRGAIEGVEGVRVHDLYAAYPDMVIDVRREKELLLEAGLVIFQHPIYWYSSPAVLKQWQDDVLEYGWAYGDGGDKLVGKGFWSVVSTGGPFEAYGPEGYNRFEMRTILSPFDQTAHLCGMRYLEPFIVHSARRLGEEDLTIRAGRYRAALERFVATGELP